MNASRWCVAECQHAERDSSYQEREPRFSIRAEYARLGLGAAEAMKLLLSLGLLVRDPKTGRVQRGEPTLTTEHEVRSLGAAAFHRQMLERAAGSIESVPRELRDLAALTVCVSPETVALVKERIHRFRESLTELCDSDTQGRTVYQLNVQWFPLSVSSDEVAK